MARYDGGSDNFSSDWMRQADHEAVQDIWHRIEHRLDLGRGYVGPRGLDHCVGPAGEVQVAGVVEPSPVTGRIPAVGGEDLVAFCL